MFATPTYIVLDLPTEIGRRVTHIRHVFDEYVAGLPPEITLAGSSGLGVIGPGQSPLDVFKILDEVGRQYAPIQTAFDSVECFPATKIHWLRPRDRTPFDALHNILRASSIDFESNSFPFNPHCTLTMKETLTMEEEIAVLNCDYPKEEFELDAISLYAAEERKAVLLQRFSLSGKKILTCSSTLTSKRAG